MAYARYLVKIPSGCYYFRYVLPARLRILLPLMQGEFRRSLNTHSSRKAGRLARALWLGTHYKVQIVSNFMAAIDHFDELERIADQHFAGADHAKVKRTIDIMRGQVTWLRQCKLLTDIDIEAALQTRQLQALYDKYRKLYLQADREIESDEEADLYSKILGEARKSKGLAVKDTLPTSKTSKGASISEIVDEYCAELRSGLNWADKTYRENLAIYEIFSEKFENKEFAALTQNDLREHKEALRNLPKNHNKKASTRNLSLHDILRQKNQDTISNNTINKHFNRLSALFNWAKKQGYCKENYAEGMSIKQAKKDSEAREAFSNADLKVIFGTPIYTANKYSQDHYYWLPLLALFTGARLQELSQLYLKDIYLEGDIWVIDINGDGTLSSQGSDKKLKNSYSKRLIPIPEVIIRIGFIQFVENQKKRKHERLFPDLKQLRDGYGQYASKWFQRHKRTLGFASDGRKTFHSFRHNFSNSLKQNQVIESIAAALTGHQTDGITYGRYGKDYNLGTLKDAIEKVKYEGLEIEAFKWA